MELSTCQHRYTLSSSSSSATANCKTSSGNLARNLQWQLTLTQSRTRSFQHSQVADRFTNILNNTQLHATFHDNDVNLYTSMKGNESVTSTKGPSQHCSSCCFTVGKQNSRSQSIAVSCLKCRSKRSNRFVI